MLSQWIIQAVCHSHSAGTSRYRISDSLSSHLQAAMAYAGYLMRNQPEFVTEEQGRMVPKLLGHANQNRKFLATVPPVEMVSHPADTSQQATKSSPNSNASPQIALEFAPVRHPMRLPMATQCHHLHQQACVPASPWPIKHHQ